MTMDKAENVNDVITHAKDVQVLRIINALYVPNLKISLEAAIRSFHPVNAHASLGTTIQENNYAGNVIILVKYVMESMLIIVLNVME